MPNTFSGATANTKPVLAPQVKADEAFGAIAIPNQKPGPIALLKQRMAIGKAQTSIMRRRVEAAAAVQHREITVVRDEAMLSIATTATLNGLNIRAAAVAEQAAVLGGLQTALLAEKAAITSELVNARIAATFANLASLNEKRKFVEAEHQAGNLTDQQAVNLIALLDALFAEAEESTDETYNDGRRVHSDAFKLATKTAGQVAHSLEEKKNGK